MNSLSAIHLGATRIGGLQAASYCLAIVEIVANPNSNLNPKNKLIETEVCTTLPLITTVSCDAVIIAVSPVCSLLLGCVTQW